MPHHAEPYYTVQAAADALGIKHAALFQMLRARRVLDGNNVPAPRFKLLGYVVAHNGTFDHPVRGRQHYSRPMITGLGLAWLRDVLAPEPGADALANERTHRLLRDIAHLNPDAAEIGPGRLRHIVTEAQAILAARSVPA